MLVRHQLLRAGARCVPRRCYSTDEWSRLESKAAGIVQVLEQLGQTVGVAELASGGLISAALWTSPSAHQCFKGGGVRLAYGINRDADQQGRDQARSFVEEKMSSGFGADGFEARQCLDTAALVVPQRHQLALQTPGSATRSGRANARPHYAPLKLALCRVDWRSTRHHSPLRRAALARERC